MAWILLLQHLQYKFAICTVICILSHFIICASTSGNCHLLNTPGVTIPNGDIIIEEGEPLEIFCIINDSYMENNSYVTSKDIIFVQNDEKLLEEWVTYVNRSTARLYIERPPPSQSMYTCKLKATPWHKSETAICLNKVWVGTKPSDVKDFSCIGHNFENLTCSWIEPEHYVKTTYNLTYYFPGRNNRNFFVCPNMTKQKNVGSCFWDISTRPHYRQSQSIYNFILNMHNHFGNHSQRFTFYHFSNVIPEPPENLKVVNKTTNSVTLSWSVKHPMNLFPSGVIYRIVYQSEFDRKNEWHVANTSNVKKSNSPVYVLTGLKYAHVLYDIRVSMRSSKAQETDEKMWSKNVSVTVRTESALPGVPPKTDIGSFEAVRNGSSLSNVFLYWQSVPEYTKNGENFSYKIFYIDDDHTEKKVEPVEINNSYAKIVGLNQSVQYRYKIVSQNEIGYSIGSSIITIPPFNRVLPPQSFTKIAFGKQVFELSWFPSKNKSVVNYTIFYCRDDFDRPYQCSGYLNWTTVPSNITWINITVPENKMYQFAISANTETSSSGMVWASCTVIHDKEFSEMKNLWIDSIGSSFIEVGWKLECSDRIGSIEGFIIYYCPIVSPVDLSCREPVKNVTISGEPIASRGRVTNLQPYTTYMLTVAVRSKHNNGLPSAPLYNTTLEAAPAPPENVTVLNVSSTSVSLQWLAPKEMNGILRYYEVRYTHDGHQVSKKPENEKSTEIELKNLNTFTEYNISVYAWTAFCSQPSTVTVKTSISTPGKMRGPNIKFQNSSVILVGWMPPVPAGGNLDVYQLRVKEKTNSRNITKIYNTTDLQWEVHNCDDKKNVIYLSVRAINNDNALNKRYFGEWSDETENYCRDSPRFIYWFSIVCGICVFGVFIYFLKRVWNRCKIMRDVEVKLPPGLAPTITNDLSLSHWPVANLQKSQNDDPLMQLRSDSSADEELLLMKKAECGENLDRITNGDSSGCSSGHESVTSSLASGTTLSSSSDSGTEQPRTPTSESISRENSLRQRRTGSEGLGWDSEIAWPNTKGYVLSMQLPEKSNASSSNWTNKPSSQGNYCVLGVDSTNSSHDAGSHGGYVPVPVSAPHADAAHIKSPPYIKCDAVFPALADSGSSSAIKSPTYIKKSDIPLKERISCSTTVQAQSQPQPEYDGLIGGGLGVKEPLEVSSPTYVMAGGPLPRSFNKSPDSDVLPTGKLINIEPLNLSVDNYIQHSADIDKTVNGVHPISLNSLEYENIDISSPYVNAEDLSYKDAKVNEDHLGVLSSDLEDSEPLSANSYCRLGWNRSSAGPVVDSFDVSSMMPSPRTVAEANKSYVPHRQFENKSLKED